MVNRLFLCTLVAGCQGFSLGARGASVPTRTGVSMQSRDQVSRLDLVQAGLPASWLAGKLRGLPCCCHTC